MIKFVILKNYIFYESKHLHFCLLLLNKYNSKTNKKYQIFMNQSNQPQPAQILDSVS